MKRKLKTVKLWNYEIDLILGAIDTHLQEIDAHLDRYQYADGSFSKVTAEDKLIKLEIKTLSKLVNKLGSINEA